MIDITGPKVLLPATLFALLSPETFLRIPDTGPRTTVLFGALVFVILYSIVARALKLVLTKTDLVSAAALYMVLTPHVFLSVPNQPGLTPVMVHGVIYAVLLAVIRYTFPQWY